MTYKSMTHEVSGKRSASLHHIRSSVFLRVPSPFFLPSFRHLPSSSFIFLPPSYVKREEKEEIRGWGGRKGEEGTRTLRLRPPDSKCALTHTLSHILINTLSHTLRIFSVGHSLSVLSFIFSVKLSVCSHSYSMSYSQYTLSHIFSHMF